MEDTDIMPYGKHKGKEMQDVPADYLLYLLDNDMCTGKVKQYIIDNKDVLESEIETDDY